MFSRYIYLLAIVFLTLALLPFSQELSWDRNAIHAGEYWRLFSGHFVHTNLNHWLMNMITFVLVFSVFYIRNQHPLHWPGVTVVLILIGGVALLFSSYRNYVGFSGVIHGLIAYWGLNDLRLKRYLTGSLIVVGLSSKLITEQLFGGSEQITRLIAAPVAIDAHLIFAITGAVLFLVQWLIQANANQQDFD